MARVGAFVGCLALLVLVSCRGTSPVKKPFTVKAPQEWRGSYQGEGFTTIVASQAEWENVWQTLSTDTPRSLKANQAAIVIGTAPRTNTAFEPRILLVAPSTNNGSVVEYCLARVLDTNAPVVSQYLVRLCPTNLAPVEFKSWENHTAFLAAKQAEDKKAAIPFLIEALGAPDSTTYEYAFHQLGHSSPPEAKAATPVMLELLQHTNSWQRRWAAWGLGSIEADWETVKAPLVRTLKEDTNVSVRLYAAYSLGLYGDKAHSVVPDLINALKDDPRVAVRAADALGRIADRSAIPHLQQALESSDEKVRQEAAEALAKFSQVDEKVTKQLAKTLNAPTWSERLSAAESLVKTSARDEAVPKLITLWSEVPRGHRFRILNALIASKTQSPEAATLAREALTSSETSLRGSAAELLGQIADPQDATTIAKLAHDSNPHVSSKASQALLKFDISKDEILKEVFIAIKSPHWNVRMNALKTLVASGDKALPQFKELLQDKTFHSDIQNALLNISKEQKVASVPLLIEMLRTGEWQLELAAARTLAEVGPAAAPALPNLLKVAEGQSPAKHEVFKAIGASGTQDEKVIEKLTEFLGSNDWTESHGATEALAKLSPMSIPPLIKALQSRDSKAHLQATTSISKIGPDAADAMPELFKMLNDPDDSIRSNAAMALGKIGAPAIPGLTERVTRGDTGQRLSVLRALEIIGPQTTPIILQALEGGPNEARIFTFEVLGNFGDKAQAAVPKLIPFLDNASFDVRVAVTKALGRIDSEGDSTPHLADALKDSNAEIRYCAARSLQQIGKNAKSAVPQLALRLDDQEPAIRLRAAFALADLRAETELLQLLKDKKVHVRQLAAFALGLGTLDSNRSTHALVLALSDHESEVRRQAARSLARLKREDIKTTSALIQRLSDKNFGVAREAAFALGEMKASAAIRSLKKHLDHSDSDFRRDAALALTKLGEPVTLTNSFHTPGGEISIAPIKTLPHFAEDLAAFSGCGSVSCAAYSPDGRSILAAGNDGTLRLWDVESRRELQRFSGNTGNLLALNFSPDGRFLLSGDNNGLARLWDVETGKELREFRDPTTYSSVFDVAFLPDGKRALTVNGGGSEIQLWDIQTGKELRRFGKHSSPLQSAAVAPDGKTFLVGDWNATISLWDTETGKEIRRFAEGPGRNIVSDLSLSADGKRAVSAHRNERFSIIWDVETGREIRRLELTGYSNVETAAFSPKNSLIITGTNGGMVHLWNADSGRELLEITPGGNIRSVGFSPDGTSAFAAGDSGLRIIQLQ